MAWPVGGNREERLRTRLVELGLDAAAALTPENAAYLAGQSDYIATHWRIPGLFTAVAGRDGGKAVVRGDFGGDPVTPSPIPVFPYRMWTESVDVRGQTGGTVAERVMRARPEPVRRPEQFDLPEVYARVADAIRWVAGDGAVVATELSVLPAEARQQLATLLPGIELRDAGSLFDDLRALKDPDEIAHLRLAGELTEVGIAGAIARLQRGQNTAAVNALYQIAVHERVVAEPRFSAFRQAEGAASIGIGADAPGVVADGQTVKFDMQVDVAGYHSDIGRTVAFAPTADQRTIYRALREALARAQERVRPGSTCADVYETGAQAMADAGFRNFSRGHLGHSVGLTQNFEEPPFIAPGDPRTLESGMVVSLELPYYVYGVGAFQLERMLLVTADGHEPLDRLPFQFALGEDSSEP